MTTKPPHLTDEDRAILEKQLANRDARRAKQGPPAPGISDELAKKWQEPFLAGGETAKPYAVSAREAMARGLPAIGVHLELGASGLAATGGGWASAAETIARKAALGHDANRLPPGLPRMSLQPSQVIGSPQAPAPPPASDGVLVSLAGPPETPMVFLVVVGRDGDDLQSVVARATPAADSWLRFDAAQAMIAGAEREVVCLVALRAGAAFAYCAAAVPVGGVPVFVIAGCSAALMAQPSCAQVLAYGTLGAVAASLRLGDA